MSWLGGHQRGGLGAAALKKPPTVDMTPTEPAFLRWLGDSVVAKRLLNGVLDGPIRVFHGSPESFEIFGPPEGSGGEQPWNAFGSWFTEDEVYASKFKGSDSSRGRMYAVYLSIQNPLKLRGDGAQGFKKLVDLYEKVTGNSTKSATRAGNNRFKQYLKDKGYDGVVLSNFTGDLSLSPYAQNFYIALDPWQIKSVNNRGTWDGSDPNILHGWRRR